MQGRGWWFVGALALSGCGIAAAQGEGSEDGAPAPTLTERAVEGAMCDAPCRWGCDAEGCDVPEWVVVGDAHSCALRESGSVDCWGSNDHHELGDESTTARARAALVGGIRGAIGIDAGAHHTCVIDVEGAAWCWGANDRGQLGDGTTEARGAPVMVRAREVLVDIAAGGDRTCAATREGDVLCWGAGDPMPRRIVGATRTIELDVGDAHACAVRADGEVACWGDNADGQLGDGTRIARTEATPLGLHGMIAVRTGRAHTCAIDATTQAVCWGDNSAGQLGDGTREDRLAPSVQHRSVLTLGGDRTCGRVAFGDVACWGEGYGVDKALVPILDEASVVTIGARHGCAVHRIGTARCWGANEAGQIGDGTNDTHETPIDALPPS
ncbi:RCC1 domain-containing protein [Sandaracinus amylolyticus]|uniref:RCC1 domain-containing protein n=1 Tax=Sandaracinus amylolyticus TaxID=927083 RepID=UPI0009FAB46D|nr:hypothetical protein [Sandaracinus amylolyticus]